MLSLKKLLKEGFTVTVSGAGAEYPKLNGILDIIFAIDYKMFKPLEQMTPEEREHFNANRPAEILSPDGNDFDKPTGTINFYIGGIPKRFLKPMLEAMRDQCDTFGIQLGPMKADKSGMMVYRGTQNPMDVIRIPVISNPNAEAEQIPELNLSNSSAHLLFGRILGIPETEPQYYSIPVEELEQKLAQWTNLSDEEMMQKLQQFTTPTSVEKGGGHATMIVGGYDAERLYTMLDNLNRLVKWAKAKGYKNIVAT